MQKSEQRESHSASRADERLDIFARQAPRQRVGRPASHGTDAPEKRLMVAVLMNAVLQLRSRDARGVIAAENWIREDDGTDWPFSFNNICDALDIEASCFARGLLSCSDRPTDAVRRVPVRQVRAARERVVLSREDPQPAITKPPPR
jgi:hypothetical protein